MVPVNGATLGFFGTTGLSNTNDISNLSVNGIAFDTSAGAFNISGNSIQLGGAIVNTSTATQTIALGIQLTSGTQTMAATAGNIVLNGVLSDGGSGYGFHVTGPNAVVLGAANTYTGATTINSGTLTLANAQAVQYSTVAVGSSGALGFAPGITAPSVPGLTGAGNVVLTTSASEAVQMIVGATGVSSTFGGTMNGIGGLTKQGAGTFALTSRAKVRRSHGRQRRRTAGSGRPSRLRRQRHRLDAQHVHRPAAVGKQRRTSAHVQWWQFGSQRVLQSAGANRCL